MDSIIEFNINKEVFEDDVEYFFNFLTDRFEGLNELWIKELEKKFNKKFQPIWILSAKQNNYFKKKNYLIINERLKELKKKIPANSIVYLQDYENLNEEFSKSQIVKELYEKLLKKQDRVFILGFTSSNLNLNNPNLIVIGPDPKIATKFDNKIEHIKLFEKLDLPRNSTRIYDNFREIENSESYPFYISGAYTSGGHESAKIFNFQDLEVFYSNLREINKKSKFLVADLISDIYLSPNVNAIVLGEDKTEIICISDQILRGVQYLGNIYPSNVNEKSNKEIREITKKIGNYLSKIGFRGLFGLDFIIDSNGKIYSIDLNPRRQGGYLCNVLMSKKINILELELNLALNEPTKEVKHEDFQQDFAWAHSKLKPYIPNMRITNEYLIGNPKIPFDKIGEEFKSIFYPKGSLVKYGNIGYIILSGNSRKEVKEKIIKKSEICISRDLELYEGLN